MTNLATPHLLTRRPATWKLEMFASRPVPTVQQAVWDSQFSLMQRAFYPSGGIVSSDDVVRLLRGHSEQPISTIARWIVARQAVTFERNLQTMLPLFQFDIPTMTLKPRVTSVARELLDVFDNWAMALWFAQSNEWLAGCAPVDIIDADFRAVLDAARADRFVARG